MDSQTSLAGLRVTLVSTYEVGRQPFGLASPAAWLRGAGAEVTCVDLSLQPFAEVLAQPTDLLACYVPMHTATRLAVRVFERVRETNLAGHLCAYGLYAPMNADFLRKLGVGTILGGEFEEELLKLCVRLARAARTEAVPPEGDGPGTSVPRLRFRVPDRSGLPALDRYARLMMPNGTSRVVGYTEASRGCKHLCRHCPIVPVYKGRFRLVAPDVVLEDVRQQVRAGAQHITFGDPDFFNGAKPALELVRAVHDEFPELSYDVTIKVEHLLQHADALGVLRETGCVLVTSAVESIDDEVLRLLDKGHTRADFVEVVRLCREHGLPFAPTFVAFTPWISLEGYGELLEMVEKLGLVDSVPPVQLAIRLLIPAGSRLLELEEVRRLVGDYDEQGLFHPWAHADPRVDVLQKDIERLVQRPGTMSLPRDESFRQARRLLDRALGRTPAPVGLSRGRPRVAVPYLTEPWYCCAEPTDGQAALI
jgi:radical SAM superfamily enzyme YgiQ (UPF0313 family)